MLLLKLTPLPIEELLGLGLLEALLLVERGIEEIL